MTRFTLDSIHFSMLFSWNIPPSPSPPESKSLFCTSVSPFLLWNFLKITLLSPLSAIFIHQVWDDVWKDWKMFSKWFWYFSILRTTSLILALAFPILPLPSLLLNIYWGDFLGDPVAKTLHSQCLGPGFDSWPGDWILWARSSHAASKKPHMLQLGPATAK